MYPQETKISQTFVWRKLLKTDENEHNMNINLMHRGGLECILNGVKFSTSTPKQGGG